MTSSNFNIRGIPFEVMSILKKEVKKRHVSLNTQSLGLNRTHKIKKIIHHDLDHLSGTLTPQDYKEFESNNKIFNKIDKELWK